MRSRWNLPVYIVYLGLCLATIGYIVGQMGIPGPGSHPYTVTITFHDAAGILQNNEVFMNGTRVGHVGEVQAVNGEAQVQVVIDDPNALPLHPDAIAEVRKKNLLGETYVDIQRGTQSGEIPSGGQIPVDHTITSTQIDQVLAVLDPQTVQRVQLLINAAGGGLANNGDNMNAEAASLNTTVSSLNGPATVLATRQQQLQAIVLELQKFYQVLANQRQQVEQEFITWNQVMAQLAAQESEIGGTVQQADLLLTNLDTILNGNGAQTVGSTVRNLWHLNNGTPDGTLVQLNGFLTQTNQILNGVVGNPKELQAVHDIFPHLGSSFADTTTSGQNLWSVYAVNCVNSGSCDTSSSYSSSAPEAYWTSMEWYGP